MQQCNHCLKRVWFWQVALDTRFGYVHIRCFNACLDRELWAAIDDMIREIVQKRPDLLGLAKLKEGESADENTNQKTGQAKR